MPGKPACVFKSAKPTRILMIMFILSKKSALSETTVVLTQIIKECGGLVRFGTFFSLSRPFPKFSL